MGFRLVLKVDEKKYLGPKFYGGEKFTRIFKILGP
jgi:hypothetical protein